MTVADGKETDAVERWFHTEIEVPAAKPLEKVRADADLEPEEWARLIRYAALLDIRTPASYMDQIAFMKQAVPEAMEETMSRLESRLRSARTTVSPPVTPVPDTAVPFPLRITIDRSSAATDGKARVKAEITVGRQLWLWNVERLVTTTYQALLQHRWHLLRPNPGSSWFTSDHPVVRVNFQSWDEYDFGGGWGSVGRSSEILLPLSPQRLLYTQTGKPGPDSDVLSPEHTLIIQKLIAARAHRWIIAWDQPRRAEWFRPRVVDREAFQAEKELWNQWREKQASAEAEG